MARELTFKLKRKEFKANPIKIERKKLYGWTKIIAQDEKGNPCKLVSTDDTGKFILDKGDTGLGVLSLSGEWINRNELKMVNEDGESVKLIPSSFNTVIELKSKISTKEFLDYSITALYVLSNPDDSLFKAIGKDIYQFDYCYLDCEGNPAFILSGEKESSVFMAIGQRNYFEMLSLEQPGLIDEDDDQLGDENYELDFSMF